MMKGKSEQKDQHFSIFLRQVREESDVLAEDLVEGLMDISQFSVKQCGTVCWNGWALRMRHTKIYCGMKIMRSGNVSTGFCVRLIRRIFRRYRG